MNDSSLLVHLPNHLCGGGKKHANVRGPYVHENFDGDRSGWVREKNEVPEPANGVRLLFQSMPSPM